MVEALLIALVALIQGFVCSFTSFTFDEPIMSGFWVGLVLGDPIKGIMIGATINIAFLGWVSVGGANPSDKLWAGLMGTYIAMKTGVPLEQSVALAVPIALLGNYINLAWMTLNSFWPHVQDKYAAKGDYKSVQLIQVLGGPSINLVLRVLPVFIIVLFGTQYIEMALSALPIWAIKGLGSAGMMMPALGMSMLFRFMYKKELLPFFLIGFAIAAYTGMTDLVLYAIIAIAVAMLFTKLGFDSKKKEEVL